MNKPYNVRKFGTVEIRSARGIKVFLSTETGKQEILSGEMYGDQVPGSYAMALLEGIELTPVRQCYCGHFKTISFLVCRRCRDWSRSHR